MMEIFLLSLLTLRLTPVVTEDGEAECEPTYQN